MFAPTRVATVCDVCPYGEDPDADGRCSRADNCPTISNPDQLDTDGDGVGDACECQPATCASLGVNCGTVSDGCDGTLSCGECVSPETCGGGGTPNVCGCAPESDAEICSRLGAQCGTVTATDNCGASRSVSCGTCSHPETCGGGGTENVCGCTPESDTELCARLGKNCGSVSAADNCGASRTVSCGSCTAPETCGGAGTPNICGCTPDPDASLCAAAGKNCGTPTITDNCGSTRTVSCGSCAAPDTCGGGGTENVCGCAPEPDASLCAAAGKNCGTMTATDVCGQSRTAECGTCSGFETCGGGGVPNVCGCTVAVTCAAAGADCGGIPDGCGGSLDCGTCSGFETCGGGGVPNVCGCTPATCSSAGADCGTLADGCGGTLACGQCVAGMACAAGGSANVCGFIPVANAGPDQVVPFEGLVQLDGTGSFDGDGEPLTYSWAIVDRPVGSSAVLSDPTASQPTFVGDTSGVYTVELVVSDPQVPSAPDLVLVTIELPRVEVPNLVGLTQAGAAALLGSAGLVVGTVGSGYSAVLAPGVVLNQSPAAGASAFIGSPVHLTIVVNRAPVVADLAPLVLDPSSCLSMQIEANDPDTDPLTFALAGAPAGMTIDAQTGLVTWYPSGADVGQHTVEVRVTDDEGRSATAPLVITVQALADVTPPRLEVFGPSKVAAATPFTVIASAGDDVGVTSVRFYVDGLLFAEPSQEPFEITYNAGDAGTPAVVRVVAADAAGNATTTTVRISVEAEPDTAAPAVSRVLAPAQAAPGESVWVAAVAEDDFGIVAVEYQLDGVVAAQGRVPERGATITVPADATTGVTRTLQVVARDAAGNTGSNSASIAIVAESDTEPPSAVAVSTPVTGFAGASVPVTATAVDSRGVARVVFEASGTPVGEATESPYTLQLPLAQRLAGGALRLSATVYDHAGNSADAEPRCLRVLSPTDGAIFGYVLDDTTGRPVHGAAVRVIAANDRELAPEIVLATDARGRYGTIVPHGRGALRVQSPARTGCDRSFEVSGQQVVRVLDCRLTPLAAAVPIQNIAGATLRAGSGRVELWVPPGAFGDDLDVSLTLLGEQALVAPLPLGFRPVSFAYVAPPDRTAQVPLVLSFSEQGDGEVLGARWDAAARAWIREAVTVSDTTVTLSVDRTGAVGLVQPDAAPFVPPAAGVGQVLAGLGATVLPPDASAAVLPAPRSIVFSAGSQARVLARLNNGSDVPSGTPIRMEMRESYTLEGGRSFAPPLSTQDLLVYRVPSGRETRFVVTPAPEMTASLSAVQGLIELEARPYPQGGVEDGAGIIGTLGGLVSSGDGVVLRIPAGALAETVSVEVAAVLEPDGALAGNAAFELLGAADVEIGGSLEASAELGLQVGAGVMLDDQVLVIRTVMLVDGTAYELVGIATLMGDTLWVADGGLGLALPGVRESGRYSFVRPAMPVGFVTGQVLRRVDGAPSTEAMASSSSLPFVSLTANTADAFYVVAAAVGDDEVFGRELSTGDVGRVDVMLAAPNEVIVVNVSLVESHPSVVSVSPADGAVNVPPAATVLLQFSESLDPATVTAASVQVAVQSTGTPVAASVRLQPSRLSVVVTPDAAFADGTQFEVRVATTVRGEAGGTLAGNQPDGSYVSRFTTKDVTPPHVGGAGDIELSVPTDGNTQIVGHAGATDPSTTVVAVNKTTGQTATVIAGADGGFAITAAAALTDAFELLFIDAAGNETRIGAGPFRNADGSTVIGEEGGLVKATDGSDIEVVVPPDAVPPGTVIRVTSVPESGFTATGLSTMAFVGGVRIEMGSVVAKRELEVSLPVPTGGGFGSTDTFLVFREITFQGTARYELVEEAAVSGGRVATASPPFPGILATGLYALMAALEPVAIGWASLSTNIVGAWWAEFASPAMCTTAQIQAGRNIMFVVPTDQSFDARFFDVDGVLIHSVEEGPAAWTGVQSIFFAGPILVNGPFRVANSVPKYGAAGVSIDQDIYIEFSDGLYGLKGLPICSMVTNPGHCLCVHELSSTNCIDGDVELLNEKTGEEGTSVYVQRVARFTPKHRFRYGQTYEIDVEGIQDASGSRSITGTSFNVWFRTYQPTVIATIPTAVTPSGANVGTPRALAVVNERVVAVAFGPGGWDGIGGVGLVNVERPRHPIFDPELTYQSFGRATSIASIPETNELISTFGSLGYGSTIRLLRSNMSPPLSAVTQVGGQLLTVSTDMYENGISGPQPCLDASGMPSLCDFSTHPPREIPFELGLPRSVVAVLGTQGSDPRFYTATMGLGIEMVPRSSITKEHVRPAIYEWDDVATMTALAGYVIAANGREIRVLTQDLKERDRLAISAWMLSSVESYLPRGALDPVPLLLAGLAGASGLSEVLVAKFEQGKLTPAAQIVLPTESRISDMDVDTDRGIVYVSTAMQIYAVDIRDLDSGLRPIPESDDPLNDVRVLATSVTDLSGAGSIKLSRDFRYAYVGDEYNERFHVIALHRPYSDIEIVSIKQPDENGQWREIDPRGRVFPDAFRDDGPFNDVIEVTVRLTDSTESGVPIYFDAIDIDDPSSDEAPIDENGSKGDDNRGSNWLLAGDDGEFVDPPEGLLSDIVVATTVDGVAAVRFRVTHQPGDNFVIAVSRNSEELANGIAATETIPLTVWRRLVIEVDRMGAVPELASCFTLEHASVEEGIDGSLQISYEKSQRPTTFVPKILKGGVLIDETGTYTILSDDVYIVIPLSDSVPVPPFRVCDDDKNYLHIDLPPIKRPIDLSVAVTGELATRVFSEAYILPVLSSPESEEIGFYENVEEGTAETISKDHRQTKSSPSFWSVYVVSAYQGYSTNDSDPTNEKDGMMGRNYIVDDKMKTNGCYIFNEVIREDVADDPKDIRKIDLLLRRTTVIAIHEIGHFFFLDDPAKGYNDYIMDYFCDDMSSHLTYGPDVISTIRGRLQPIPKK